MVGKMDRWIMERSIEFTKMPDEGQYQFSLGIGFKKNRRDLDFALDETERSLVYVKTYYLDMWDGVQKYNKYSMNQELSSLNDEIYPNLAQVYKAMDVIGMSKRVGVALACRTGTTNFNSMVVRVNAIACVVDVLLKQKQIL